MESAGADAGNISCPPRARREGVLGKFGLILLVVLFGACMFVAGAMAPPSLRQPIAALAASLPGLHDAKDAGQGPARSGGPAAAASARPAPAGSTSPVQLDSLLVGARVAAPVPAKGQSAYALQLGQFVRAADADVLARRAAAVAPGLPLSRIAGSDDKGRAWTVLAIGRYVSPEDAQHDASRLQGALELGDLPVIRLPDPPPSAKTGA
jgi:hypothetical protein